MIKVYTKECFMKITQQAQQLYLRENSEHARSANNQQSFHGDWGFIVVLAF